MWEDNAAKLFPGLSRLHEHGKCADDLITAGSEYRCSKKLFCIRVDEDFDDPIGLAPFTRPCDARHGRYCQLPSIRCDHLRGLPFRSCLHEPVVDR